MWGRRFAHRMPWARMSLRRGSDRAQGWLTLVLIVTMVLVAPYVAWWAGRSTYRAGERASAWERQHHVAVQAVLLEDASRPGGGDDVVTVRVRVRWTGPDDALHTATVSAPEGLRAGSTVPIWVDDDGTVVPRPGRRSPAVDAAVAGLLAVGGMAAGLGGVRRIVVWRLDRRRLRSWESEWLIVGPRWSRR
ncbi:hypothetical protein [Actinoplanes sp. NPDC049681]|uniref:Rv1733c family protein n=1 Tax=Actinoplanes sp. NPDC049681 TaxID=3363905 RepID=UPI0037A6F97A